MTGELKEPRRNLVLVHSQGWQDVSDFYAIKAIVEEIAPDIAVFIASNDIRSSLTRKKAARRPTLVFSPIRLLGFQPDRGQVYQGQPMSKLIEMQRLAAGGLPVPRFEEIRPGTVLSPEVYGPVVVVKPAFELASFGRGIELRRTETVRFRPRSDYPVDHPGRQGPMVAQKFINCGRAMTCRVLTLFGAPIFTYVREATKPLNLDLKRGFFARSDFMPTPPDVSYCSTRDPDILALATAAYRAMPDVALQACDILRDQHGNLHLLEINPGGGTWMFSSPRAGGYRLRLSLAAAEKTALATGNTEGAGQLVGDPPAANAQPQGALYTVKAGDTLWWIAEAHYGQGQGAKYIEIVEANPIISDPDKLDPGQVLRIPGAAAAAEYDLTAEFDAFRTCARVLIEKTRAEAA